MKRQIRKTIAILLIVCFALSITVAAVSASVGDPNTGVVPTESKFLGNPNMNVVPVGAPYLGKTYEQWSEKWWQWAVSIPAPKNPIVAPSGYYDASIGQSGNVWFLAGTENKQGIVRIVKIPAGKSIFFPIINVLYYDDKHDQTYESMRTVTTAIIDGTIVKEVTVDGTPLKNLDNFRKGSDLFVVKTPKKGDFIYDPTLEQGRYNAVSDGYWIMLKPLSKGVHTIYIHGKINPTIYNNEVGVKYIVTVT